MIRNAPIILKKWSISTSLLKEELTRIPVWVKLHYVPIQFFSEYGISLIATHFGKPIMLAFYTSSMCIDSWGSSFARCSIEVNSDKGLKESITIGIPLPEGTGCSKETIRVVAAPVVNSVNDGFQKVVNKKRNTKTGSKGFRGGISGKGVFTNVKNNFVYEPTPSSKNETYIRSGDDVESEEEVEVVFDESANLLKST
ncbi:zinc knuckle CX2CX4HX4C containing protein, partial [Tanacetum coccineum]